MLTQSLPLTRIKNDPCVDKILVTLGDIENIYLFQYVCFVLLGRLIFVLYSYSVEQLQTVSNLAFCIIDDEGEVSQEM